jgi:hypothetical protein
MAFANFESACEAVCELAGFAMPRLEPDARGTLALSMSVHGVPVTLLQPRGVTDRFLLLAEAGPAPEDRKLECWRALLAANMVLLGQDAPVFGRDPRTGEIVVHRAVELARVHAGEILDRIQLLADLANQWRADWFIDDEPEEAETAFGNDFAFA